MGTYDCCASLKGSLSLNITTVNTDYDALENLPTINGVTVKGDLTTSDLGIERGYDATYDSDDENLILTT